MIVNRSDIAVKPNLRIAAVVFFVCLVFCERKCFSAVCNLGCAVEYEPGGFDESMTEKEKSAPQKMNVFDTARREILCDRAFFMLNIVEITTTETVLNETSR